MSNQQLSTNTFTTAKWIVSPTASDGTHTTIGAALTSASSGDTIFIRPGTYTENPTLKAGVNLTAYGSDSSLNQTANVIINGNCTASFAGSCTISGIQLQTNSANCLTVSGSSATIVNLQNCNINCSNNTGISFTSSSGSARLFCNNCTGNIGTTGIALFSSSSSGSMNFLWCNFQNTGNSSTASTISAGGLQFQFCNLLFPTTTSSTASIGMYYTVADTSATNTATLTHGGSGGSLVTNSYLLSGTASTVSISATLLMKFCTVNSSNTSAIAGAGTLTYSGISFSGSSKNINVSTMTGGILEGGIEQAPSSGFIGQQISNFASSVSLSNASPKTITSVNLTAGIWSITGMISFSGGGGAVTGTQSIIGISTTNNTLPGSSGVNQLTTPTVCNTVSDFGIALTLGEVVLTTSTTYYLIGQMSFSAGTITGAGTINAVRVG